MSKVVVMIPCLNEQEAIGGVVDEFRSSLPQAEIVVCDNGSSDATAEEAKKHGASVLFESRQGKGNVVRRMFADLDADIYVMVDGDGTYCPGDAQEMIRLLEGEGLDMIIGSRMDAYDQSESRSGHKFGNRLITSAVNFFFKVEIKDALSGYRVMSRRFVKTAPVLVSGFEIEANLTIHALEIKANLREVPTSYGVRAGGTESKLRTFKDGFRIFGAILYFFKEVRPFIFFGFFTLLFSLAGLVAGVPVIVEYMITGLVPRFPSAILATGLMVLSAISFTCAVILDSVALQRREQKRLAYLGAERRTL